MPTILPRSACSLTLPSAWNATHKPHLHAAKSYLLPNDLTNALSPFSKFPVRMHHSLHWAPEEELSVYTPIISSNYKFMLMYLSNW